MSTERVLAVGLLLVSGWLLIRLAPAAIVSWRIYAGTGRRRQEDATGRAPAPGPGVVSRAAALGTLGYHELGQTRLMLPVGERFAQIMAADDGDSYAILVEGSTLGLTGIYSAWPDGMWLCTIHPRGEAVDRPNLTVTIVPGTLEEAVAQHRIALERLRVTHGTPRRIDRMADMLALDADYRIRFGGSRLRSLVVRAVMPAIAAGILFVLSLLLALASG